MINLFKKKRLQRQFLIKKINEPNILFEEKVRNAHILSFLHWIKTFMNDYSYKKDSRFIIYDEFNILENEMSKKLNNNDIIGSLIFLKEYIEGRNCVLQLNTNSNNKKNNSLLNDYYKDGIICEEEKNIILKLIIIIENYINSLYIENGDK